MNNLINNADYEQIKNRINKLTSETHQLWGKMTVNEMICHISDPIRDILGIRETALVVPEEMRLQIVQMVLNETPFNRDLPTFPPYLQAADGGGTKPAHFEHDKTALLDLINQFYATDSAFNFHTHAGLGVLSREQFGLFLWKHFDHHLRQFGV